MKTWASLLLSLLVWGLQVFGGQPRTSGARSSEETSCCRPSAKHHCNSPCCIESDSGSPSQRAPQGVPSLPHRSSVDIPALTVASLLFILSPRSGSSVTPSTALPAVATPALPLFLRHGVFLI